MNSRKQSTKTLTLVVKVRVPKFLTSYQARRKVRTLINDQSGFLCHGPNYEEIITRAISVRAAPRSLNSSRKD